MAAARAWNCHLCQLPHHNRRRLERHSKLQRVCTGSECRVEVSISLHNVWFFEDNTRVVGQHMPSITAASIASLVRTCI